MARRHGVAPNVWTRRAEVLRQVAVEYVEACQVLPLSAKAIPLGSFRSLSTTAQTSWALSWKLSFPFWRLGLVIATSKRIERRSAAGARAGGSAQPGLGLKMG